MNWAESKALTPLKREFLLAFFEADRHFFLTGGSALGIFYLQHRRSYDLDLFSTQPVDWHLLGNTLAGIATRLQAELTAITEAPFFHRYSLVRAQEREILDFVLESAPQIDLEKQQIEAFRVDTLREIAVNKLSTLIGRTEHKDIVDLYFLEKAGIQISALLDLARRKEGGLEPAIISWLLSQVHFDAVPEYVFAPVSVAELNDFVARLRRTFADTSFPAPHSAA